MTLGHDRLNSRGHWARGRPGSRGHEKVWEAASRWLSTKKPRREGVDEGRNRMRDVSVRVPI